MDQASTQVVEIACNLDDVSGEIIGAAVETLLAEGALDVWTTPIAMKKQRPGVTLSLLCESSKREVFARRVIELTGTFGVRLRDWNRVVLQRRHETVETSFGPIRLKVGSLDGRAIVAKPEFEDVRMLAAKAGATAASVMNAARAAADGWLARHGGTQR